MCNLYSTHGMKNRNVGMAEKIEKETRVGHTVEIMVKAKKFYQAMSAFLKRPNNPMI